MREHFLPAAVALVVAASAAAAAEEERSSPGAGLAAGTLTLGVGVDYSTGKYGLATSTDILYVPVTAKYEIEKWILKLTVPYIHVTGPGNVVREVGVVEGRGQGARRTEEGLGDLILGVTRNVYDGAATGTLVDVTGKIKFGTASADKGLGTGENDYAVQGDLTQAVTPRIAAFGSFGYKFVGNPPGAALHNAFYGEGGASYKISDPLRVGAIVFLSEAISASGPQRDVTLYVSQQLSAPWKVQAYIVRGFAQGSPDWAGGGSLTYRF